MTIDINHFKDRLAAEKARLESELGTIAVRSKTNPGDWDTMPSDTEAIAMREEVADRLEDNEEREAAEKTLEASLNEVTGALARIEAGNFGQCEVCHIAIESDRLEANPAAVTCKAHLNG